jgi:hypothetical protein
LVATALGTALATGIAVASCSSDPAASDNTFDGGGPATSTSSSGGSSGVFQKNDSGPTPEPGPVDSGGADARCVDTIVDAVETRRPVDIIFAIDNSASMFGEISEVENQINDNFAAVLARGLADYRVIMLSKHGTHDPTNLVEQRICIRSPLSGTDCKPVPLRPVETKNFIHHSIVVNSQDSWCKILTTLNGPDDDGSHPQGWVAYLRPEAFKVFAIITDDRINTNCIVGTGSFSFDDKNDDVNAAIASAKAFDNALISSSPQFGTDPDHRNYVWHSIVGLSIFDPTNTNLPHPPDAPLVTTTCSPDFPDASASDYPVAAGLGYQSLSKLTGGLRYPTCGLNYNPIFTKMAQDVIGKSVVACDYAVPANPDGGVIDRTTAVVEYTSGTAAPTDFFQVSDVAACGATGGSFYIAGDRIHLCPYACTKVQNDTDAKIRVYFGCETSGQTFPGGGPPR